MLTNQSQIEISKSFGNHLYEVLTYIILLKLLGNNFYM